MDAAIVREGRHHRATVLKIGDGRVQLTRQGLLQVDLLLPEFYAPEYRNARYT